MIIKHNDLIGLPVETKKGQKVGSVSGFELEANSHEIIRYQIKKPGLLPGIMNKHLLVHKNQVLQITPEKMIVEEALVKEKERAESTAAVSG
ncbi:MAG: PRC-barrel domain-containing protein [Patescibacteria group bacterium]|nr:PRC-barrel domain-containing protein [Patescibacteria group bacterium]